MRACVSLARYADALPVSRARLDANLQRFSAIDCAFSVTDRASGRILACPLTRWTWHVKLHAPAGLLDRTLALALRAHARSFNVAVPTTICTGIAPCNVQAHYSAPDCCPERYVYLILEIRSRLGPLRRCSAASAKDAGENIAKASAAAALPPPAACGPATLEEVGKIESAEVEIRALRSSSASVRHAAETSSAGRPAARIGFCRSRIDIVGIKAELVVNLALFRIAQDVIGFGDGFELFFRGLVSGVDVGMVLAGKFTKRLADVLGRGGFFNAQRFVIIFFMISRH